jgi:uncharacterized integral membrane protein
MLLLLSFFLIVFACYLLITLNPEVIQLDLLFIEIQPTLGISLLSFLLIGFFITLILESITKLSKNNRRDE